MTVDSTLRQRGKSYGKFEDQSSFSQQLKSMLRDQPGWDDLTLPQREALEMVVLKIARIIYGDPSHIDGWHDIAGYASLIEKILKGEGV